MVSPPSISKPFVVTPGASALVVLVMDQYTNSNASSTSNVDLTPATLAWGSQTLTKAIAVENARPMAFYDVYYLYNPTPGSNNITFTDTSGLAVWCLDLQAFSLVNVNTGVAPITNSCLWTIRRQRHRERCPACRLALSVFLRPETAAAILVLPVTAFERHHKLPDYLSTAATFLTSVIRQSPWAP